MNLLELFNSTQGEGSWAGQFTTFVRFGGCNCACVHPTTLITMADFSEKPILEIKPGDKILGIIHNPPNRQTLTKQKVLRKRRVFNKDAYRVYSRDVEAELFCSDDHRIYSTVRHGYALAKNLKNTRGRWFPEANLKETEQYKTGYLLGATYGDGWTGTARRANRPSPAKRVYFVVENKSLAERYSRYANDLGYNLQEPVICREKYWRVSSGNTKFWEFVYKKSDYDLSDEEVFRGFCAGFFDTEGCWSNGHRNGVSISQVKDKPFLKKIVKKLSSFSAVLRAQKRPYYASSDYCYKVMIQSSKRALDFVQWCNPVRKELLRIWDNFPSRQVDLNFDAEVFENCTLIDIQTETENFFANGFLVHNCSWCDEPGSIPIKRPASEAITAEALLAVILAVILAQHTKHVCFTGGEPLIQNTDIADAVQHRAILNKINRGRGEV